jgi:class 3 adenylate cyclase
VDGSRGFRHDAVVTQMAVSPVMIGRERQRDVVRSAVEAVAASDDGSVLLLAAPAGMGKSRMVAEAHRLAAAAGLTRLEGGCSPEAGVPYAPLVTALRRRTRSMSSDEIQALFGGPAAMASVLLPEIADQLGVTSAPRSAEDLFAALWRVLLRLSRPQGMLLVIEDLHWADDGTLRLLSYLARETTGLPVLLVGTYRSDEMQRRHPLTPVLAELTRERRAEVVQLSPLGLTEVRALVSAVLDGTEVSEEFGQVLLDRTDGNPFFVEELLKVLVERGDVYRTSDDWERRDLAEIALPSSIRESLLDRARTMQPDSVRILQMAAIAGARLDLDLLATACDVSPDAVDAAVVEGLERQVLVAHSDHGVEDYAFRHALTREAFGDELVGPQRRRAHERIGSALIALHASDLDTVASVAAEHFAAAGDVERASQFALRGARFAKGRGDDAETDRLFDLAVRLCAGSDEERLELLLEAADPDQAHMSPMRGAFAEEVVTLAAALGDRHAEGRGWFALSGHFWNSGRSKDASQQLEMALECLSGADDVWECRARSRYVRVLALSDSLQAGDPRLDEAEALAQRVGDDFAVSAILNTRMLIERDETEASRLHQAAWEAGARAQSRESQAQADVNYGFISLWRGRFEISETAMRRAVTTYAVVAPSDVYAQGGLAWLLSLTGRYDDVIEIAQRPRDSPRLPDRVVALTALTEVAMRREWPDTAALIDELHDVGTSMGEAQRSIPAISALARHVLATQGVEAALPVFEKARTHTFTGGGRGSHWPFSPDLAAALAAEGRTTALERWYDGIATITRSDPTVHNQAAETLVLAHLRSGGSPEQAAATFQEAADRYAELPCPARQIESLVGLAGELGGLGDTDGARRAIEQASGLADRLDALALQRLVQEVRQRTLARPVLATLLFTDIVGSTESAVSLGDRAWREHLSRHHAIVRRELARAGGREIDTAGDGFLAAFDSPTAGVRCALDVQQALGEAGIPIRAGLHTGECHEHDGKLTGLAVHIASRMNSLAQAGEVLVSSTVRDLIAGSDLELVDHGKHELKGVPGSWSVYAVRRPPRR